MQCSFMIEEQIHTNSQMERYPMERDPTLSAPLPLHGFITFKKGGSWLVVLWILGFEGQKSRPLSGPGDSYGPSLQACRRDQ
jgi:hypothetical protein